MSRKNERIWRTFGRFFALMAIFGASITTTISQGCAKPGGTADRSAAGAASRPIERIGVEALNEITDPTGVRRSSKAAERAYSSVANAAEQLDVGAINAATNLAREFIASLQRVDLSQTVRHVDSAIEAVRTKLDQLDMSEFNQSMDALQAALEAKAKEIDIAAANRTIEALEQKVSALDVAAFNDAVRGLRGKIDEFDVVAVKRSATDIEDMLASTVSAMRMALWCGSAAALLVAARFALQIYRLARGRGG